MVCFFGDGSFIFVYLAGYCIQCGLVCFFSDSSFVFIDGFFVGIDVVAVVSNLVGYSLDSIMYCGKAFVGICLVFIDSFFVSIDVFAVCFECRQDIIAYAFCDCFNVVLILVDSRFIFIDSSFNGFQICCVLVDNLGGFHQCFAVFIDGFGQVGKALVVFSYDFFQTQTFKVVGFNIGCSCFFFGNLAIFINVVDGVSGFETVDVLDIVDCCGGH